MMATEAIAWQYYSPLYLAATLDHVGRYCQRANFCMSYCDRRNLELKVLMTGRGCRATWQQIPL
jgi:hypothetical protein